MTRRVWLCAACAALIALAVVPPALSRSKRRAEPSVRHGLYTAQQILDRSLPLCRALAPEAGDLKVSVDRMRGSLPHPFWNVVATDRTNRDVLTLRWNDDTGEIYVVSHLEMRRAGWADHPLSRREVILAAERWMRILGLADLAPRWRLVLPPRRVNEVWSMAWQAEGREAYVRVHAYTGSLIWTQARQVACAPSLPIADRGRDRGIARLNDTSVPM